MILRATVTTAGFHAGRLYDTEGEVDERTQSLIDAGFLIEHDATKAKAETPTLIQGDTTGLPGDSGGREPAVVPDGAGLPDPHGGADPSTDEPNDKRSSRAARQGVPPLPTE